jgi:colanic acid biosynthesis glycosyl transferase WcaI
LNLPGSIIDEPFLVKKRFFLISQVFYPDEVSTASLFTGLCSSLVKNGVAVEVWAGQPSYTNSTHQPKTVNYKGIKIRYLTSTNFRKTSIFGRFLNILTFILSVCSRLAFSGEKVPVWTHTTYPFIGIIASFICRLKRRKFIYVLLDIFPEGMIRLGKLSGKNWLVKLWDRMFIRSLERSDRIIAIGRDIKHWVGERNLALLEKTEYIPHWHDENIVFPVDIAKNNFIGEYGLSGKFLVQYSGNMGLWNEMRAIGKAVNKSPEGVTFIFIGGGIRKEEMTKEFKDLNPGNVILLPFMPENKFNESLNASHVHLVTMKENLEGMAVPCKIYGILAAGKPVIGMVPENSEIGLIIKEENCGILLNPDDSEGLVNAINLLKDSQELRNEMGRNSRRAFETKYKVSIIADRYKLLLESL